MSALQAHLAESFELEEVIGSGSYGIVTRARDRATGERVAIKTFDLSQNQAQDYLRELRLVFRLNHPHIVRALDVHYGPINYIVYEYMAGGDLRAWLEKKMALSPALALAVVRDMALGLAYLHGLGIVHRDLKPENVLLSDPEGQGPFKLADFGISKYASGAQLSQTHTGSPLYMAPEQFYTHYDHRADLYSLGVIWFELLAGRRPFQGSLMELMRCHLHEPPPLERLPVTDNYRAVLAQLLAKDPQDRYADATALLQALTVLADQVNVLVTPLPAVRGELDPLRIQTFKNTLYPEKVLDRSFTDMQLFLHEETFLAVSSAQGALVYSADLQPRMLLRRKGITAVWPGSESLCFVQGDTLWESQRVNLRWEDKARYQFPAMGDAAVFSPDGQTLLHRRISELILHHWQTGQTLRQAIPNYVMLPPAVFAESLLWYACHRGTHSTLHVLEPRSGSPVAQFLLPAPCTRLSAHPHGVLALCGESEASTALHYTVAGLQQQWALPRATVQALLLAPGRLLLRLDTGEWAYLGRRSGRCLFRLPGEVLAVTLDAGAESLYIVYRASPQAVHLVRIPLSFILQDLQPWDEYA